MGRDTSSHLTFYLAQARWHLARWQELGSPALHVNSNLVFAMCSMSMAYGLDRRNMPQHERQHFISNVAAYGYDLGMQLDIEMHPRDVAAAHFDGQGAPHYDVLLALGYDPSEPKFWMRYSDAVSATPHSTIELPQDLLAAF